MSSFGVSGTNAHVILEEAPVEIGATEDSATEMGSDRWWRPARLSWVALVACKHLSWAVSAAWLPVLSGEGRRAACSG